MEVAFLLLVNGWCLAQKQRCRKKQRCLKRGLFPAAPEGARASPLALPEGWHGAGGQRTAGDSQRCCKVLGVGWTCRSSAG